MQINFSILHLLCGEEKEVDEMAEHIQQQKHQGRGEDSKPPEKCILIQKVSDKIVPGGAVVI